MVCDLGFGIRYWNQKHLNPKPCLCLGSGLRNGRNPVPSIACLFYGLGRVQQPHTKESVHVDFTPVGCNNTEFRVNPLSTTRNQAVRM